MNSHSGLFPNLAYSFSSCLVKSGLKPFSYAGSKCGKCSKNTMRTTVLLLCLMHVGSALNATATRKPGFVHVVYNRMDVFYAKIDKEFVGAELEVFASDGERLSTQKIDHRRVLIDFYYEDAGTFLIIFKKGDVQEAFNFVKDKGSIDPNVQSKHVSIIQEH